MSAAVKAFVGATLFDGEALLEGQALVVDGNRIAALCPVKDVPANAEVIVLEGGILAPGFVDLQVNGGGGVMLNDAPDVDTLRIMARAHARIGATTILPTLITDTPDYVARAIEAVAAAVEQNVAGIGGLHLEGPHLSISRKGAHDPHLIRLMRAEDLAGLITAAARLPVLKVTLAPESVSDDQIRVLSEAGVLVSLGHTDAGFAVCEAAAQAGARCVTHLFNAQSQLGNREPGTVGAALQLGALSAGLIADGIHVHPASMALALRAKSGPGSLFLVSDAMASAGSDIGSFTLNGRLIRRDGDRLTLEDGTLAGAHLELATAVRNLTRLCDWPLPAALAMATSRPAALIGKAGEIGSLRPGALADLVHLSDDLALRDVWLRGTALA